MFTSNEMHMQDAA